IFDLDIEEIKAESCTENNKKYWIFDSNHFLSVEEMGLYYYQLLGWNGVSDEGNIVKLIIHAINYGMQNETGEPIFGYLKRHRAWVDKNNHLLSVTEFLITKLTLAWLTNTLDSNIEYFKRLYSNESCDKGNINFVWNGLGKDFFQKLILQIVSRCIPNNLGCSALSGWPDLTLWKNNQIKFVEVKCKDKLHRNQAYWLRNYSLPLMLDTSLLRIRS
ncbi:VRR-NUC domain-containing protein, partial [Methyloglobulus sp.]|uniref:VRR-NUC domain-containing protein n=1 Tax=Methyloglobulus sp. TaxID=2518622 RepID=UPI0032B7BAC6